MVVDRDVVHHDVGNIVGRAGVGLQADVAPGGRRLRLQGEGLQRRVGEDGEVAHARIVPTLAVTEHHLHRFHDIAGVAQLQAYFERCASGQRVEEVLVDTTAADCVAFLEVEFRGWRPAIDDTPDDPLLIAVREVAVADQILIGRARLAWSARYRSSC